MKNRVLLILSLVFVTSNIVSAQTTKRVITNEDLNKFKVERESAEAEYRRTYKERGMPSPEELVEREKEATKQRQELATKIASERQQNSNYFQSQANNLRNQIINIDAQINYLNGQIASLPNQNQNQIFVTPNQGFIFGGGVVYGNNRGNYGGNRVNRPQVNSTNTGSGVQAARNAAAGMPNPYYGTSIPQVGVKAVIGSTNNVRRGGGRGGYYGGFYGGYGYPTQIITTNNNNSNGPDELISRFQYLQQVRAGLLAQWNQLREEARRSGVRID